MKIMDSAITSPELKHISADILKTLESYSLKYKQIKKNYDNSNFIRKEAGVSVSQKEKVPLMRV